MSFALAPKSVEPIGPLEIIKDRLFFLSAAHMPADDDETHHFTIDDSLVYQPFFADFGPLHLAHTYRFCQLLISKLQDPELAKKKLYFCTSLSLTLRTNAIVLVGAFCITYLGLTVEQSWRPFAHLSQNTLTNFRDASMSPSDLFIKLTARHSLRGFAKAHVYGFYNFDHFDPDEYEYYEQVENGDFNIILPGKFLAFSGPQSTHFSADGYPTFTPSDYVPIFQKYGVSTIVRLNKICYDKNHFQTRGFDHHDFFFVDGTIPSLTIVDQFILICENATGIVAVHCKAGLGRTGTLIACYMMKHYHFTAEEAIAWIRICRPGSVIGPQQQFVKQQQMRMWQAGKAYRKKYGGNLAQLRKSIRKTTPLSIAHLIANDEEDEEDDDAESKADTPSMKMREVSDLDIEKSKSPMKPKARRRRGFGRRTYGSQTNIDYSKPRRARSKGPTLPTSVNSVNKRLTNSNPNMASELKSSSSSQRSRRARSRSPGAALSSKPRRRPSPTPSSSSVSIRRNSSSRGSKLRMDGSAMTYNLRSRKGRRSQGDELMAIKQKHRAASPDRNLPRGSSPVRNLQ